MTSCQRLKHCVFKVDINLEMKLDEQVSSETIEANAISFPTNQRPLISELSEEARVKLEVILSLIEPCDRIRNHTSRLRCGKCCWKSREGVNEQSHPFMLLLITPLSLQERGWGRGHAANT